MIGGAAVLGGEEGPEVASSSLLFISLSEKKSDHFRSFRSFQDNFMKIRSFQVMQVISGPVYTLL